MMDILKIYILKDNTGSFVKKRLWWGTWEAGRPCRSLPGDVGGSGLECSGSGENRTD